jgi:class 3 adenylate cyclase
LVRAHDALVRRGLDRYGGREVKHTGDGIMAATTQVSNAVNAAAQIQRLFSAYNAEASERLSVRIGIHAGEPVAEHNDLFGATVQLASRLCGIAQPDEIIVSKLVYDLYDQDRGPFIATGERQLKGFAERTLIFRFDWRS